MPSPPAHEPKRTAEWRIAEQPLAAIGHRQRSKRHSSREETQTHSRNNVVIWMHDAHDYPSGVLAAKKHNLAWENSECTRNSEKQKSKKLKRVAQLGVKYFNNHEGESSSSIFPNSRATKHCGNIRASKSNIKRIAEANSYERVKG
jgi:hypothetical protein